MVAKLPFPQSALTSNNKSAVLDAMLYPIKEFKKNANQQTMELYQDAARDREAFWSKQAHCLDWFAPWTQVLDWNPPDAKWFVGAKLNASYNCLDRHMKTAIRHKRALIWEGERGETKTLTYEQLFTEVNQFSNVLKKFGIQKGDKVAIYMPMVPEAVVAMLSCARLGAIHTVVFAGFSAEALKDRIHDSEAKLLITADGGFRKGKLIPLKETSDEAVESCPSLRHIIVLRHTNQPVAMLSGRDHWYDELLAGAEDTCLPVEMDAEDELFILYTSGTTGKPKGLVHTTGGYMVGATMTTRLVFDIKPTDIYWCTADVGWITGHSYVVYGPLSNGMTQFLYEGSPDFPEKNRFWKMIEKYQVTTLYTAPTAIRTFMKWGEKWVSGCDLSSLRLLGTVGEPINPEAWMWYYTHIGQKKCPVVDTWWQSETGSIIIAPIPGLIPLKPGSATMPLPGIDAAILNESGHPTTSGALVLTSPWPSMARGIYNDRQRYKETYWKMGIDERTYYLTGDGAKRDEDGYFWLMGRMDDVINVSGHRLGTMEIESALVDDQRVAEAAVIAVPHELKGQGIVAFVTMKENLVLNTDLELKLKQHVVKKIGPIARPERIIFICDLPKTRSGKIMRRLLRDIAEGKVVGDVSTLADPSTIAEIKGKYSED